MYLSRARLLWVLLLALAPSGCTTSIQPTVEHVRASDSSRFRGGAQVYNLSPRQRRLCEKRAAKGDIVAAKTLVEYHEMITRDGKQYHYWLKVVAQLEKAQLR